MSYPKQPSNPQKKKNKTNVKAKKSFNLPPVDKNLLIVVLMLAIFGVVAIFSASAPRCAEAGINPAKFLIVQLAGVAVGFAGLKFFSNLHYKRLMTWTIPFTGIVILLLFAVKIFGPIVNGAQRWLELWEDFS